MSTCITIKSANERCHTVLLLEDRGGSTFKLGRPGPAMACICVLVFFLYLYCIILYLSHAADKAGGMKL